MTASSGNDPITYYWQEISGPGGPPPTLTNSEQTTDVLLGAAGTYDFRCIATDDSTGLTVSSDASVTVDQVATSITVTPGSVPFGQGATTQLTAVENDQFANAMAIQPTFSWSVADPTFGTISSSGKLTELAPTGIDTEVQAQADGLVGSAQLLNSWPDVVGALNPLFPSDPGDFDHLPSGTDITTQIPEISFSNSSGYSDELFQYEGADPNNGHNLLAAFPGETLEGLTVNFAHPAAGLIVSLEQLQLYTNGETIGSISFYSSGTLLGTESITANTGAYVLQYAPIFANPSIQAVTSIEFNLNSGIQLALSELNWVPMVGISILGDGSTNQVLQATSSGTQNLVPLHLSIPQDDVDWPAGTQVTLSTSAPSEVDVWNTANPTVGSTPLLGGSAQTSSTTWTVGTDNIPSTLYVGATAGSQTVGDITFTLAITAPGSTTPIASATTAPATAVRAEIVAKTDPNGLGILNNDISGQKNLQWVVGQNVDLTAQVPGAGQNQLTYKWTVQGPTLFDYTQTPGAAGSAISTQLAANNQGNTGTHDQEIKFFWLESGVFTVTLQVTNGGVQVAQQTVTFDVIEPTGTFSGTPTTTVPPVLIENNFRKDANKNPVQVFSYGDGNSPGMTFNGSVATGNFEAGKIEMVQLVQGNQVLTPLQGNATPYNTPGYLLDDDSQLEIPYVGIVQNIGNNANQQISSDDTPNFPTAPYQQIAVKESFHTFLMYQPTGGQGVALEEFDWFWAGTASFNQGVWTVANPVSPAAGVNIPGNATTIEPTWTDDYQTWTGANGI
jgi:hypothetical protein